MQGSSGVFSGRGIRADTVYIFTAGRDGGYVPKTASGRAPLSKRNWLEPKSTVLEARLSTYSNDAMPSGVGRAVANGGSDDG
jgi:hypothetical protein